MFRSFPVLEISGGSGNSQPATRSQDPVTRILLTDSIATYVYSQIESFMSLKFAEDHNSYR